MDDRQSKLARATALHEAGAWDDAARLYEELLQEQPSDAEVLCGLGTLQLFRRRTHESVATLEKARELRPDLPEVRNQLGVAYKSLQRWGDASREFEHALQLDNGFAASYFHLGEMAMSLGQWDAAVSLYRQAIGLAPHVVEPHLALGNLLFTHRNWSGAAQCFQAAIEAGATRLDRGTRLELKSRLGVALLRNERLDEAAAVFLEMLKEAPQLAEIHSNLAFVFERQGKLEEAVRAGRRAIELNPHFADGYNNLGVACRSAHLLEEAEQAFSQAIVAKPDFPLARFNRASVQLLRGNYREGWVGYEDRQALIDAPARKFNAPRWTGEPILEGALLLHAEQGFGDTLQFIRFAARAREACGVPVIAEVPQPLVSLISRAPGIDQCLTYGQPHPRFTAEVPLPSLPGILGVDAPEIADSQNVAGAYLVADPTRVLEWNDLLQKVSRSARLLRIGIAWQGNPAQSQNVIRSTSLKKFSRLRSIEGVQWFSLQKDVPADFRDDSGLDLVSLGPQFQDFDDTAAVMASLDLVITVDTSIAHLAGALGRPVWTLLCYTPDWRWQLHRQDCPWYPSMRLFRQPRWGDWDAVFDNLHDALREFVSV